MTPEELRRDHRPVLTRMLERLDSEYDTAIESFSEDYFQVWEEWCAIKSAMDAADTIERLERENAELRRIVTEVRAYLDSTSPREMRVSAAIDAALAAQPDGN